MFLRKQFSNSFMKRARRYSTKLPMYLTLDVGDLVQTICPGSAPILRLLGANGLVVYCAMSGADTVCKWKHSSEQLRIYVLYIGLLDESSVRR